MILIWVYQNNGLSLVPLNLHSIHDSARLVSNDLSAGLPIVVVAVYSTSASCTFFAHVAEIVNILPPKK